MRRKQLAHAYHNIGMVYFLQGDYGKAIRYLEQAYQVHNGEKRSWPASDLRENGQPKKVPSLSGMACPFVPRRGVLFVVQSVAQAGSVSPTGGLAVQTTSGSGSRGEFLRLFLCLAVR